MLTVTSDAKQASDMMRLYFIVAEEKPIDVKIEGDQDEQISDIYNVSFCSVDIVFSCMLHSQIGQTGQRNWACILSMFSSHQIFARISPNFSRLTHQISIIQILSVQKNP